MGCGDPIQVSPWPVPALNSGNRAETQRGNLEGERRDRLRELILKDGHVLLCCMYARSHTCRLPSAGLAKPALLPAAPLGRHSYALLSPQWSSSELI